MNTSIDIYHSELFVIVGGWAAGINDLNQWLMADLHSPYYINTITTQGRQDWVQWITSYKLHLSMDSIQFETIQDTDGSDRIFEGNADQNTRVMHYLPARSFARYVKLTPLGWVTHVSMRWGLTGFRYD